MATMPRVLSYIKIKTLCAISERKLLHKLSVNCDYRQLPCNHSCQSQQSSKFKTF